MKPPTGTLRGAPAFQQPDLDFSSAIPRITGSPDFPLGIVVGDRWLDDSNVLIQQVNAVENTLGRTGHAFCRSPISIQHLCCASSHPSLSRRRLRKSPTYRDRMQSLSLMLDASSRKPVKDETCSRAAAARSGWHRWRTDENCNCKSVPCAASGRATAGATLFFSPQLRAKAVCIGIFPLVCSSVYIRSVAWLPAFQHSSSPVRPNQSLKPSPAGGPPGPGCRYAVHFRQPGPGVPPSVPA